MLRIAALLEHRRAPSVARRPHSRAVPQCGHRAGATPAWPALCLALLLAACARLESEAEALVDDRAALLTDAEEAGIGGWQAALLGQHDIDYRVVTVGAARDLSDFAVRHFEQQRVGERSKTGRGLLLVVDAGRGEVRLEVGRALEGIYVDSFVAFVQREQMAPFFAAGRVGDGIVATTELIAARAAGAAARGDAGRAAAAEGSAGAGAQARATVGTGYERPAARVPVDTAARATPLDTVAAYVAAMAAHDAAAELDLYTPETRRMLAAHVVTRAQMDNLVRTYRACPPAREQIDGDVAVVDHPGEDGGCAPWLLRRGPDGAWRLDLATMQRALRFDTRNHWNVAAPDALGDYVFAFRG